MSGQLQTWVLETLESQGLMTGEAKTDHVKLPGGQRLFTPAQQWETKPPWAPVPAEPQARDQETCPRKAGGPATPEHRWPQLAFHEILQARILEWVAFHFLQGIFPTPRIERGSCALQTGSLRAEPQRPWAKFHPQSREKTQLRKPDKRQFLHCLVSPIPGGKS